MKFYYYVIENIVNHKKYVGITTNPRVRKNRHFNYLRQGKHPNPILQNSFNFYGEDKFIFTIIDEQDTDKETAYQHEHDLIMTVGEYPDGFNCNVGGLASGPKGLFTREEVFQILAVLRKYPSARMLLSEIFNCSKGAIDNVKRGVNYHYYYTDFQELPNEEKDEIFNDFNRDNNFEYRFFTARTGKNNRQVLTSEQIFVILYQQEFGYPKRKKDLLEDFHLANYSVIQQIVKGITYKQDVYQYSQLTYLEKYSYAYHYAEMHNRKPPELLETPSGTISSQDEKS